MRATITITTEEGAVYTGDMELLPLGMPRTKAGRHTATAPQTAGLDFGLPVRPFIKKYATGMSGPKRLALLVARFAEGDVATDIQRTNVRKTWDTMTSLLGGRFNPAYDTRARENGWISSPKPGLYRLLPNWSEIFQ